LTDTTGRSGDARKHLLEELDELHLSLHDGVEFQRDIPLLNEPVALAEDDTELTIPILTDSIESAPEEQADSKHAPSPDEPPDDDKLDQLLDELVAEHLPRLEQKLRDRLREMIQREQLDLLDNTPLNNHVDEG